jgi:hypothetical protein
MTFLKFPEPVSLAIALRDPSLRFVARDDFVNRRKLDSSIREKRILLVAISRRMADVSPED